MGVDAVELIMSVEDAFQITIQDAEAESLRTVGDLYCLVGMKTKAAPAARCLSAQVFYRLRKAIACHVPGTCVRLRPATPLGEALPLGVRRAVWPGLAATAGLGLPELQMSPRVGGAVVWAVLLGSLLAGILLGMATVGALGVLFGFGIFIVCCVVLAKVGGRVGRHVPSCPTVGDLARLTLCRNFAELAAQARLDQHRELWECVCRVVGDGAHVPAKDLRPETRIADLC